MPFTAVWAHQSPTLLNLFRASPEWDLRVADLGDCSFQEKDLLTCLVEQPDQIAHPDAVFVCAPGHFCRARKAWPKAKLVWVFHQGYPNREPQEAKECCAAVCFHPAIAAMLETFSVRVLTPHFPVSHQWKFGPTDAYMMMSRPRSRPMMQIAANKELLQAVETATGKRAWWYGEQAPDGFRADPSTLYAEHACYLSRLPWRSGIGLAEHEAMAAGMPMVGAAWGAYWETWNNHMRYCDTDMIAAEAKEIMTSRTRAENLSELQQRYVGATYSTENMNDSIARFIGSLK